MTISTPSLVRVATSDPNTTLSLRKNQSNSDPIGSAIAAREAHGHILSVVKTAGIGQDLTLLKLKGTGCIPAQQPASPKTEFVPTKTIMKKKVSDEFENDPV